MTADAETYCSNSVGGLSVPVSQMNHLKAGNFFPSLLPEEEIQKVIFD